MEISATIMRTMEINNHGFPIKIGNIINGNENKRNDKRNNLNDGFAINIGSFEASQQVPQTWKQLSGLPQFQETHRHVFVLQYLCKAVDPCLIHH